MITVAMMKWAVSLVHTSPIPGFFLEQANRSNFYWDMVAFYNLDFIESVGYEGAAHTKFSSDNDDYLAWVYQAFLTIPCLGIELEDPNGKFMLHIMKVDREHANTGMLENPQVLVTFLDILTAHPFGSNLLNSLRVKDAASLGSTSKSVRLAIGYDPFKGHNKSEKLGSDRRLLNNRKNNIDALALHAFNHIYDVIQPYVKTGGLTRQGDIEVRTLSQRTNYGQFGNRLSASNCLAITHTPSGEPEGAVNFIYSDWFKDNKGVDQNGLLNNQALHLGRQDYRVIDKMHGEIRLMQRQHDRGVFRPIYVDKFCCPFCAVQFIAMGLMEFTPGAVNNKLAWYTFSPYVIYFKSRRVRMWGQVVEMKFSQLTPEEKSYFLFKLASGCSFTKHKVKTLIHEINF